MAGERKGKTYEALVKIAIDELIRAKKLNGKIFWNDAPSGMSIEPDLVIGPDKDHPTHVLLIAHSGSAKNSDMKFWRNMGELVEAKTCLATAPHVYSVGFDSVIKEDLKKLQDTAFDGQLIVGDGPYGDAIQKWVDDYQTGLPNDANDKVKALRKAMQGKPTPGNLKPLILNLAKDLERLLKQSKPELERLWLTERNRKKGRAPTARTTLVRRGLAKLLLFDPPEVAYQGTLRGSIADNHEYLIGLGVAAKSLLGLKVTDRDVQNVTSIIEWRAAKSCVTSFAPSAMRWIRPLRALGSLEEQLRFVGPSWVQLCRAPKLFRALADNHLGELKGAPELGYDWLFYLLMGVVKVASRRRQGYGLAQLLADIRIQRRKQGYPVELSDFVGAKTVKQRGLRSIERLISVQLGDRSSAGSSTLYGDFKVDMMECAVALAARLDGLDLDRGKLQLMQPELRKGIVQANLENGLLTYRLFEPLPNLVIAGVPTAKRTKVRSCFAEAVHGTIRDDSSSMSLLRAERTLINWQSAHGSHTNDKKKELCGRAVALRYAWDSKAGVFIPRPGVKKLILVVDGTWKQQDLDALVRAGWDEIFYPDEMDKLAKAVV